jgi:hypothetical protein
MLKVSTLRFHAGVSGETLMGLYFLLPRLTGALYHDFP